MMNTNEYFCLIIFLCSIIFTISQTVPPVPSFPGKPPASATNVVNGISYTDGYIVNATYSNAPYSCSGGIVAADVQVFSYSQCIVNNGSILDIRQEVRTPSSVRYINMRAYRRRLDVSLCNTFLYFGYTNTNCSGVPFINSTKLLSGRYLTNNGGCYFGRDSSCSYNYPGVVISSNQLSISTSAPLAIISEYANPSSTQVQSSVSGISQFPSSKCFFCGWQTMAVPNYPSVSPISSAPSVVPTPTPSVPPTSIPLTTSPTAVPTFYPTFIPVSGTPPTFVPSVTVAPSAIPSTKPTSTKVPSYIPSGMPSFKPTDEATMMPTNPIKIIYYWCSASIVNSAGSNVISSIMVNKYRSVNGSVACKGTPYSYTKYIGKNYGSSGLSYMQAPTSAPTSCVSDSASTREGSSVMELDAVPIRKVQQLIVQNYVPGYRIISTYQNAPYSCEGKVVSAIVEYYNYSACFQTKNTSAPSFLRLLNVGTCQSYVEVYYKSVDCTGKIVANETVYFNNMACQNGTDFTCVYTKPSNSLVGTQAIVLKTYPTMYTDNPFVLTKDCNGPVGSYALVIPSYCFYYPFVFGATTFRNTAFYYGKATLNTATNKFTFNYYSTLLNCQNNIPSNAVNAYKGVAGTCLTTNPLSNPNSNFLNGNIGYFRIGLYQSPCYANLNSGSNDDNSLSGGAIAGIVIGVVAFCVLFAALIYYFYASKSAASGVARNGIEVKSSTPNPVNSSNNI